MLDYPYVKAYVDGSYEHAIREYGSGVVILKNDIVKIFKDDDTGLFYIVFYRK